MDIDKVTYKNYREKFLNSCRQNRLDIFSITLGSAGPENEELCIDIAHGEIRADLPTLIHVSGCHGIEGYLGSAIQTAALARIKEADGINVCFVHGLNPYGMAWYRRGNGANVDLNRNFFKNGEERPVNSDFAPFAPLFQWWYTEPRAVSWLRILKLISKYGIETMARHLTIGQYEFSGAAFYGGKAIAKEIASSTAYLKAVLKTEENIFLIDVHTGLGKRNSENWLMAGEATMEEKDWWTNNLSQTAIDVTCEKGFYKPHGALSLAFRDAFEKNRFFYICQEFGTKSPLGMLGAMIKDQRYFHQGAHDQARISAMLDAFYPGSNQWRDQNIKRGVEGFYNVVKMTQNTRSFKIS